MTRSVLAAALLLPFFAACDSGEASDEVAAIAALTGDAAAGQAIYDANCTGCHGADGTGGSGPDITGEDDTEEMIEYVFYGDGDMPAHGDTLEDQEIADVVAYAQSL